MNKELDAFNRIMGTYGTTNSLEGTYDDFLIIKKALQRLESIDNANSNEALEGIEDLRSNLGVIYNSTLDTIEQYILKAQEQEKFIDIVKRKGMFISAKELNAMNTYEDYKSVINERKLQQELMMHITPALIDWSTLESTPFYTEKEFDIVKRSL